MKLSEAIRLGTTIIGPVRGVYFQFDGDNVCGCLIGTALYAVGYKPSRARKYSFMDTYEMHERLITAFPIAGVRVTCPICQSIGRLALIAEHLYEIHKLTREAIADWVATIEPQDEPVTQPEPSIELAAPGGRGGGVIRWIETVVRA